MEKIVSLCKKAGRPNVLGEPRHFAFLILIMTANSKNKDGLMEKIVSLAKRRAAQMFWASLAS